MKYKLVLLGLLALGLGAAPVEPVRSADPAAAPEVQALASLDVPAYMGTWYQVAWYPNRFQSQCVSDTQARYRLLPEQGAVEVTNRCRLADGRVDGIVGIARPVGKLDGNRLAPAQLEVSFLPRWLRWLPIGWGRYWVVHLAPDARYAIVSEPSRDYLWVLARSPSWSPEDQAEVRKVMKSQGFDTDRLQSHPQKQALP